MATKMHIEDHFDCSAQELYDMLADDDFDTELMAAIKVGKELIDSEERPEGPWLKIRLSPDTQDLPGFMRKVVGEKNAYVEERAWNKKTLSNTWTIIPDFSVGKVSIGGTFTIKDAGAGKCVRVVEGDFSIKVPLLGGKIEKFIIKQTEETFRKNTAHCKQVLAKK